MSWKQDQSQKIYSFYQDDIVVHIFATGNKASKSLILFWEDAYEQAGYEYTSVQGIKDRYGIDVSEHFDEERKNQFLFSASILHNQGLGNEIKNLPNIKAETFEEAQKQAKIQADQELGEDNWLEVKVRPLGPCNE